MPQCVYRNWVCCVNFPKTFLMGMVYLYGSYMRQFGIIDNK